MKKYKCKTKYVNIFFYLSFLVLKNFIDQIFNICRNEWYLKHKIIKTRDLGKNSKYNLFINLYILKILQFILIQVLTSEEHINTLKLFMLFLLLLIYQSRVMVFLI